MEIHKPHTSQYYGAKLPDFSPLALYLHKQAPVQDGDDVVLLDETAEQQEGRQCLATYCYVGNGASYIDVSAFVTGTLTVRAWVWDTVEWALVDLSTEVNNSNKHITLVNGYYYKKLHIKEDGDIVAIYTGEEVAGSDAVDVSGHSNHGTIVLSGSDSFFGNRSDVPFAAIWSNVFGYSPKVSFDTNIGSDTLASSSASYKVYENALAQQYRTQINNLESEDPDTNETGVQNDHINYYLLNNASYNEVIYAFSTFVAKSISFDIDVIYGYLDLTFRDYTLQTRFDATMLANHSISSFTQSTYVNTAQKFYDLISGTNATHGDDYPNAVGITGLTCTQVRAYLTDAGVTDVAAFVTQVGIKAGAATDLPMYRALILQFYYRFDPERGAGRTVKTFTTSSLAAYQDLGFLGTAYFSSIDQIMVNITLVKLQAFTQPSRDSGQAWVKLYQVNIDGDGYYPALSNGVNDAFNGLALAYSGKMAFNARCESALVADFPNGKLPSSKLLKLVEGFYARPSEWDTYQKGNELGTVEVRQNGSTEDRICVFESTPTGTTLTRSQRFTKNK